MSKSSRRKYRNKKQEQELHEAREEMQNPNPRVKPVSTARKANGKNRVPQTRQQAWPTQTGAAAPTQPIASARVVGKLDEAEEAKATEAEETKVIEAEEAKTAETEEAQTAENEAKTDEKQSGFEGAPAWLDGYLKYQSEFTEQLANQILEDHRVLTDHEWRIHDLEKHCFGVDYVAAPKTEDAAVVEKRPAAEEPLETEENPVKEQKPADEPLDPAVTQPIPVIKPDSATETIAEPKVDPKAVQVAPPVVEQPIASAPKGAVPRQMYEAEVFEDDKWVLYGPFPKISRAEQATNGDLSKIHIVQVWYDHDRDVVIRQLTPDELDRYCK